MTPNIDNPHDAPASLDPVAVVKRELDLANVRYEAVFARREEIVAVLPGRGLQRVEAQAAAAKAELQGRFYVSIVSEVGAPKALQTAVLVFCVFISLLATFLMFWAFIGGARAFESDRHNAEPRLDR